MDVNYIRQMTAALVKFEDDDRLNPAHISLYLALFQFWNLSRFRNPVSICRADAMRLSKIGSRATYHKCIKDLHNWGYLEYMPSHNPYKGSRVYMFIFGTSSEPAPGQSSSEPGQLLNQGSSNPGQVLNPGSSESEQALVPSINNINSKQNKQGKTGKPAGQDEVDQFFKEEGAPLREAQKFFNYYSSNGWKVGGRSPMKDWKAAARNWIIKVEEIEQKSSKNEKQHVQKRDNLRTGKDKDYGEPL